MSYVQCKDTKEVEAAVEKLGDAGFVSPDYRIYTTIEFWDDACVWTVDANTFRQLADLQSHLEMLNDGMNEMPMTAIERRAKDLREQWDKTMEAIKFRPLKKELTK